MVKHSLGERNRLLVLSAIAEYQTAGMRERPQQKDIVERIPLTKGSVSNHCRELESEELLIEYPDGYEIGSKAMLKVYREFLEPFFIREVPSGALKNEIERTNRVKTNVKNRIESILTKFEEPLFNLILSILVKATNRRFKNLRETMYYTNQVLLSYSSVLAEFSELTEDRGLVDDIFSLCACLGADHAHIQEFSKDLAENLGRDILLQKEVHGPNRRFLALLNYNTEEANS